MNSAIRIRTRMALTVYRAYSPITVVAAPRLNSAPQRNSSAGRSRSGGVEGTMHGCYSGPGAPGTRRRAPDPGDLAGMTPGRFPVAFLLP